MGVKTAEPPSQLSPIASPSRRTVSFAALSLAMAAAAPAVAAARPPLGVQLYSLGDLRDDKLAAALNGVAAVGYATTELAGYFGHTAKELRAAHDAAGLRCISAHVGIKKGDAIEPGLDGDLGRVAEDMHTLGATAIIVPGFPAPAELNLKPNPGESFPDYFVRGSRAVTAEHWKQRAARLNTLTERFKGEGLALGYHNHFGEFLDLGGGRRGIDILLAETSPQTIFELDVGWAVAGGADPIAVLKAHPTRFKALHVKDMVASTAPGSVIGHRTVAVGAGDTDWRKILATATRIGATRWFVELEPPFEKPRLELLKASIDYLAGQNLVSRQTPRAA